MTIATLSKTRWIRLLSSWLRTRKTAPIKGRFPLTIWELEDRVAAGSVFHLLFGGLSMGYLMAPEDAGSLGDTSATAILQHPDSASPWSQATAQPVVPDLQTAAPYASAPPSADAVTAYFVGLNSATADTGDLGGLDAGRSGPIASAAIGGTVFASLANEGGGGASAGGGAGADAGGAASGSTAGGGGSANSGPGPASPGLAGPRVAAKLATSATNQSAPAQGQQTSLSSAINSSALTQPSLAQLGLIGHAPLGGQATSITSASAFAPQTLLSTSLSQPHHGHNPAQLLGNLTTSGISALPIPSLGRTTVVDATGVVGSLSPAVFLNPASGSSPFQVTQQLAGFQPQADSSGSFASIRSLAEATLTLGQGHGSAAASSSSSSAPGSDVGGLPPSSSASTSTSVSGGTAAPADIAPPADPVGSATVVTDAGGASGAAICTSSSTSGDPLHGTFSFTLNLAGSDAQGAYSVLATGTVTIDIQPDASGNDVTTGSVQITSQFHRGGGGVSPSDPSTTQTLSFDPTGSGLLLGFDIDGYTAGQYGIDPSSATSYSLTVSGSDQYSTTDTTTNSSSDSNTGETTNDSIQGSDSGSETLNLTVSGTGSARNYVFDDTVTDNYTYTENSSDQVQNDTASDLETVQATDNGSETVADHEQGTVDSSGQLQTSSFQVSDQSTDSVSATDTVADQSSGSDQLTDNSTQTDQANVTQTVTISGSPSSWSGSVSEQDDDNMTLTDQGQDNTQSNSNGEYDTTNEQWNESDSGPVHDAFQASIAGDSSDNVNGTNVDLTITATIASNSTDTDTATAAGSDFSAETQAVQDHGQDQVTLHATSPDGTSGTVTESETLAESPSETDSGNDSWSDPYSDPATSTSGTDTGSDLFNESNTGSDNATITSSATIDASGTLGPITFSADLNGSASVTGTDSGNDTIAIPGESDGDQYTDGQTAGDSFGVHLASSGSSTTATIHSTISDSQSDTDNQRDTWNNSSTDIGSDTENSSDGNTATISVSGSAAVDSSGALTPTGGQISITGSDNFTDPIQITDDAGGGQNESSQAGSVGEKDQQTNLSAGTDQYAMTVTQAADGSTTIGDSEGVNENVNITSQLTQDGGRQGDSGSATLSGSFRAALQQTASTLNGEMTVSPTSGSDQVNLRGTLSNTTDCGPFVCSASENVILLGGPYWLQNGFSDTPVGEMRHTVFTDNGLSLQEADSETAGAWTEGSVQFSDAPSVVVTRTMLYTPFTANWNCTEALTDTITESMNETVQGTGPSATGSQSTLHQDVIDHIVSFNQPDYPHSGIADSFLYHSNAFVQRQLQSSTAADGSPVVTDTTQTHTDYQVWQMYDYIMQTRLTLISGAPATLSDDLTTVTQLSGGNATLVSASGSGSTAAGLGSKEITTTAVGTVTVELIQGGTTAWTYALDQGAVLPSYQAPPDVLYHVYGNDPYTGAAIDTITDNPGSVITRPVPPEHDEIKIISDYCAAIGDTVSAGTTARIRQQYGYDDAVNHNSQAYRAGMVTGEALNLALMVVNPCGAAAGARWALRGLNALQALGNTMNASDAFNSGDVPGGLTYLASAYGSASAATRACFAAGTPLLTPTGDKPIEEFKPGDWILSAPEDNPEAPPEAKQVEEVFVNRLPLLELHTGGRVIRTTSEHPFFVPGRGWTAAHDLMPGDRLRSDDGRLVVVDGIVHLEDEVAVYNLRVAEYHTYFVGNRDWGFSVWAHNTCVYAQRVAGRPRYIGITGNIARRTAEHLRNGRVVRALRGMGNVTRKRARALEHLLIEKLGRRGIDPKGILDNVNRGIDPRKLSNYTAQLTWARNAMASLGL
jgi:hypothetical protein